VRTITINSGESTRLKLGFDAAEVRIAGDGGAGEIGLLYGYFADGGEILDEEAMRPESSVGTLGTIVLQQTAAQIARARSAGAHLRVTATIPRGMAIQDSRIENGTLFLNQTGGFEISLGSGTVEAVSNNGRQKISVTSGTLRLAGFSLGFRHAITTGSGTITLQSGLLLPFVDAEVEHGVIQGEHLGRLESLGNSGWRLVPLQTDPDTALQCRVEAGTILLQAT
jgi:hypothetical protein